MDYANNSILKLNYSTSFQEKKSNRTSMFKKHKFLSIALSLFIIFSCINFFLIYYFMSILQNL